MTVHHTRQLSNLSISLEGASRDLGKLLVEPEKESQKIIHTCCKAGARDPPSKREHPTKRSSWCRIRSRLLNSLGIEKEHAAYFAARTEPSTAVQRGQDDAFNVVLKADHGKVDKGLEQQRKISSEEEVIAASPGNNKPMLLGSDPAVEGRGVCFDAEVTVHPIPRRSDYSSRMHAALWTPAEEIQQNAARNQFEFAAEEWDYRKVVDDEDMVLYAGERVHPIHFMEEEELKEYFRGIVAQQKLEEEKQSR